MTHYYTDDLVTLHHGPVEAILPTLADESFDVTVTSPPYNMGVTPGGNGRGFYRHTGQKASKFGEGYEQAGDDGRDPDEYAAWLLAVLDDMLRVTRHAVFLNHRPRIVHGSHTPPIDPTALADVLARHGAQHRQTITWDRGTGIDVHPSHYCTRGEWIYVLVKPSFRLVDHSASGMGDVWRITPTQGSEHPAPFPVELPERCILSTGATSVLDPFAGSGSTLLAAKRNGVRAVGIEKAEAFCALAAERLGGPIRATEGSLFG